MMNSESNNHSGENKAERPTPLLIVIKGSDKGKKALVNKAKFIVGRKVGDFIISDSKISSAHLALEYQHVGYTLLDLDSTNGTTLNGKRIKVAMLNHGDEIGLGTSVLKFVFIAGEDEKNSLEESPEEIQTGIKFKKEESQAVTESFEVSKTELSGYCLKISAGDDTGKIFELSKGRNVIGRVNADINLEDKSVARKHAIIEFAENGEIILRDLTDKEGVFVNNRRVLNLRLLGGETIQVGSTVFQFIVKE